MLLLLLLLLMLLMMLLMLLLLMLLMLLLLLLMLLMLLLLMLLMLMLLMLLMLLLLLLLMLLLLLLLLLMLLMLLLLMLLMLMLLMRERPKKNNWLKSCVSIFLGRSKIGRHNNDERVLEHLPGTRRHIIEQTGMPVRTAYNVLKRLHEAGKIHIGGWRRTPGGGPFCEFWHAGPGVDAYCQLRPMTQAAIWKRYKSKLIRSGDNQDRLAAKRARYWADKQAKSKTKATWLSALGISA